MFGLGQKSPLRKISTLIFESFSIEPFFLFFEPKYVLLRNLNHLGKCSKQKKAGYNTLELLAQFGFAISKTELGIENKTTLYTNWLTT